MVRARTGGSWRRIRLLTLILLGLLLASPLSTGDKGLWLSVAATPVLFDAPADWLPAEHSTLVPDRSARSVASARVEQTGTGKRLAAPIPTWISPAAARWKSSDAAPTQALHALFAARPEPRAPPA